MRDRYRVQRPFELLQPEIEELVQHRKDRAEIVVLPDIGLQKPRVIRSTVENIGRRQSIAFKLLAKLLRHHSALRSRHGNVSRLAALLQASKVKKLFTFKALAASLCSC